MILVLHCAGLMAWARSSSKLKSLPLGSFTVALNYNKSNSVFQLSVLTERFHYQVTAMVGCNSTCSTLQLIPAFCLIIPRQFSSAHYSVLFPMHSRWENSLASMKNSPTKFCWSELSFDWDMKLLCKCLCSSFSCFLIILSCLNISTWKITWSLREAFKEYKKDSRTQHQILAHLTLGQCGY